jgi:DDE superfamily endonuclease
MIIDDSIEEKPYTDENEIVCWHYDHSKDRLVKGINFMTALYHSQGMSLPVGFTLIAKTEHSVDKKDGKTKRRSPVTKNEYVCQMLQQAVANRIPFKYMLNDVWFASTENRVFIKPALKKDFIMPMKTNRKVALSLEEKLQGKYIPVDTLVFEDSTPKEVYLQGVSFPLLLVKQVFTNDDSSTGVRTAVGRRGRPSAQPCAAPAAWGAGSNVPQPLSGAGRIAPVHSHLRETPPGAACRRHSGPPDPGVR